MTEKIFLDIRQMVNAWLDSTALSSYYLDIETGSVIMLHPELEDFKRKIEALIQQEKLYQNPEFTLADLAKKLQTNVSIVSRTINQGFHMNFNDFINNYRIEAVKTMFQNGEHKKSTLLGIAFDCGFNSKATFNRAFKKNTGFSPKEYLEKI